MIASKNEKLISYRMKQLYLERLNLCEILLCSIYYVMQLAMAQLAPGRMAHLSPSQPFWIESQLLRSVTHGAF